MMIFMYCFLMRGIQTQSMIADITDEHEWDHGERQEGSFFAANNFAIKMATVAGPLYGGLALELVGLETGMLPGSVGEPVLLGLLLAYGIGTLPGFLVGLLFALRMTLSRARVEDLQEKLRQRSLQRDL